VTAGPHVTPDDDDNEQVNAGRTNAIFHAHSNEHTLTRATPVCVAVEITKVIRGTRL
jgi:hypothetical protein